MKPYPECFPCFLKQPLIAARLSGRPEALHLEVQRETVRILHEASWEDNPPAIGTAITHAASRILGVSDPYAGVKKTFNRTVKRLYPELRRLLKEADDRFTLAVRFALAGNIIDFGILESFDLHGTFARTLEIPLNDARVERFRKRAAGARRILYLADNAGEIGFDRFLIEEIRRMNPKAVLTLAVKHSPVINDATAEDARFFGIDRLVPVIDTGLNWIGTHPERSSPLFREHFEAADLVVSKGMGNWESLEHRKDRRIVYLLKAKCPVVARLLKVSLNEVVVR